MRTTPLRNKFPVVWKFLGIPRNSKLFQDMQIMLYPRPWNFWEYLGIVEV